MQHSGHRRCCFPFSALLYPLQQLLIADAGKQKHQPAWLRQDSQPFGDSLSAANLLSAR